MIIVSFHYRLPGDPKGEPEGAWREFTSQTAASLWLSQRQNKTETSPKGGSTFIYKSLADIPDQVSEWKGAETSIALQKSITSYLRYKSYER